jgi:hypothetical protein
MQLSAQQCRFFDTFGYLVLLGLLREDLGWIEAEFDALTARERAVHHLLDRSPRLAGLLEHPAIVGAVGSLLGEDWSYFGSGGVVHRDTETGWHTDSFFRAPGFLRLMAYLDPLSAGEGALHVIPSAHRTELSGDLGRDGGVPWDSAARWGMPARQIPNVALPSTPGDVILFDINTPHASFGGGRRRRKIDLTLGATCRSGLQRDCLQQLIEINVEHGCDRIYLDPLIVSAPPQRLPRLREALAFQPHLEALASRRSRDAIHPRVRRMLEMELAATPS